MIECGMTGRSEDFHRLRMYEIDTLQQLFHAIDKVGRKDRPHVPNYHVHYCKDIFQFLGKISKSLTLDIPRLKDHKLITFGGKRPDDWYGLKEMGYNPNPKQTTLTIPSRILPHTHYQNLMRINGSTSEEVALKTAMKESLKGDKEKESKNEYNPPVIDDFPTELCCPLSLNAFKDPVKTSTGQTYERKDIEDWFTRDLRDPLTNELTDGVLVEDTYMKMKIQAFLYPSSRSGRGGRGRGRGIGRGGERGSGRGVTY